MSIEGQGHFFTIYFPGLYVLCFTRSRYQVSVYRTNGPLVSETIAASDLKIGRSRHLIEFMKVCEYWRSRSFLDLGPRLCTYKNSKRIFSETTVPF